MTRSATQPAAVHVCNVRLDLLRCVELLCLRLSCVRLVVVHDEHDEDAGFVLNGGTVEGEIAKERRSAAQAMRIINCPSSIGLLRNRH